MFIVRLQRPQIINLFRFFKHQNICCPAAGGDGRVNILTLPQHCLLLSLLYLLHRVDLVSLKLQQLLDGILPWGDQTARKVC